jgi:amino acid transporter
MKLLARIFFLILTIVCGLWLLASIPNVIASFKRPDDVAGALGEATVPFILFSLFLICYAKLQPEKDDANPSAPQTTGSKVGKAIVVILLAALIAFFVYLGVKTAKNPTPAKNEAPTQVRNAS